MCGSPDAVVGLVRRERLSAHDPVGGRLYADVSRGVGHGDVRVGVRVLYPRVGNSRQYHSRTKAFACFKEWSGRTVLEIGTGMGGDLSRFLSVGADAVGVDLSSGACEATTRRLELWDLPQRFARADAIHLPFPDAPFDLVWSRGVFHHIAAAIAEARRVLRPGTEMRLMLYHHPSWVALALWVRWALLRGKPATGLRQVVAEHMESPGTLALTRRELLDLVADLEDVDLKSRRHVLGSQGPARRRLAGSRLGWCRASAATPKVAC